MAAAEITLERDTEASRVVDWRRNELERAGYDGPQAQQLAERGDVDLHVAVDLVRGGCPPDTAIRILL